MLIPAGTTVSTFTDAEPGSLLIGSLRAEKPNLIGLRADYKNGSKSGRYIVVLNPWEIEENQHLPYLLSADPGPVLNLGREWSIDIELTPATPNFGIRVGPLSFSGDRFYLLVQESRHGICSFLDVKAGEMGSISLDGGCAYWPTFRILIPQPGMPGPGVEIFAWPSEQNEFPVA